MKRKLFPLIVTILLCLTLTACSNPLFTHLLGFLTEVTSQAPDSTAAESTISTEAAATAPLAIQPAPTEPAPTEPPATQPAPTEPAPTESPATQPAPTEPAPTESPATQPAPTEPPATQPAPTEPAPTEPPATQPAPTEPAPTEPPATQPAPTEPAPTEPPATQPAPTEPAPTESPATQPAPTEPAPTEPSAAQLQQEVLALVNVERQNAGLAPLSYAYNAQGAADVRAAEILSSFSHTRPNGTACFTALDEQGVTYYAAGENIAYGYPTAQSVVAAWMDSPGHRANILSPDFTSLAVGVSGTHWVQLFLG